MVDHFADKEDLEKEGVSSKICILPTTKFGPMYPRYLLFTIILLLAACQQSPDQEKTTSLAPQVMVSTAHPLATEAGLQVLESGGNAFDAAVAIAAALNVVEPMMSGMGGYGTILIYDAGKKEVRFLDSSGKIPLAMNSDLMRPPTENWEENRRGAKSISTPGNVNAWGALSRIYGQKEWSTLFAPAIALAEEGFPVSARLEEMLSFSYDAFPDHAKAFYGRRGRPLQKGDTLVQKDLARSLRLLAQEGRSVFYEGALARKIDSTMRKTGSFLSIEDLRQDQAEWWEPIHVDYHGYRVYTASPPANAFPALLRLGLMRTVSDTLLPHNSVDYLHAYAEVTKHAFWARLRYAGDPEINPPPLDKLLSEAYWEEVIATLPMDSASTFQPPNYVATEGRNTTHFVVADQDGNIVSATQTLGNLFGSKVMPQGTGIWLNNSLAYCTYVPKGNPMDAIPGQRKLSGDCPTIIFQNDRPVAALGTPGGHTIAQTVPQMVMNLLDYEMDISSAIAAPRVSFVEPNFLAVEEELPPEVINTLEERGHMLRRNAKLGNAHGLTLHYAADGTFKGYRGAADPRGEGMAKGF